MIIADEQKEEEAFDSLYKSRKANMEKMGSYDAYYRLLPSHPFDENYMNAYNSAVFELDLEPEPEQ